MYTDLFRDWLKSFDEELLNKLDLTKIEHNVPNKIIKILIDKYPDKFKIFLKQRFPDMIQEDNNYINPFIIK